MHFPTSSESTRQSHMKCPAAIFLPMLLTGCSLIEPSASARFNARPGTSAEVVYTCAESTIRALKSGRATWSDDVTTRDVDGGILETGDFGRVNIAGIRTRIRYRPDTGAGTIRIKASGPYFADLGADQAAARLANGIAECL